MATKKKDYKTLYEQSLKKLIDHDAAIDKLNMLIDSYDDLLEDSQYQADTILELLEQSLHQDYTLGYKEVEIGIVSDNEIGVGIMFSGLTRPLEEYPYLAQNEPRSRKSVYIRIDTVEALDILGSSLMLVRNQLVEKEKSNVDGIDNSTISGTNSGEKTPD